MVSAEKESLLVVSDGDYFYNPEIRRFLSIWYIRVESGASPFSNSELDVSVLLEQLTF